MARILDLSNELLSEIFSYLTPNSIKNVRLACSAFRDSGSPYLIPRVYFARRREVLNIFRNIVQHPVFCHSVTILLYDVSSYDQYSTFNLPQYESKRLLLEQEDIKQGEDAALLTLAFSRMSKLHRVTFSKCEDGFARLDAVPPTSPIKEPDFERMVDVLRLIDLTQAKVWSLELDNWPDKPMPARLLMSSLYREHTKRALQTLRQLSLAPNLDSSTEIFWAVSLLRYLASTPSLTHLTIGRVGEESSMFSSELLDMHFPKLQYLHLWNYRVSTHEFENFMLRHADTMQELILVNVSIKKRSGSWEYLADSLWKRLNLKGVEIVNTWYWDSAGNHEPLILEPVVRRMLNGHKNTQIVRWTR